MHVKSTPSIFEVMKICIFFYSWHVLRGMLISILTWQNKRKIKSEMAKNVSYWNKNYCVTNIVYHMYHCVNFAFQKVQIMWFYLYKLTSTTTDKSLQNRPPKCGVFNSVFLCQYPKNWRITLCIYIKVISLLIKYKLYIYLFIQGIIDFFI